MRRADGAAPSRVFIACVRQAWIVRQQHANPVGPIAADGVMDPGALDQQVNTVALPEVPRPAIGVLWYTSSRIAGSAPRSSKVSASA